MLSPPLLLTALPAGSMPAGLLLSPVKISTGQAKGRALSDCLGEDAGALLPDEVAVSTNLFQARVAGDQILVLEPAQLSLLLLLPLLPWLLLLLLLLPVWLPLPLCVVCCCVLVAGAVPPGVPFPPGWLAEVEASASAAATHDPGAATLARGKHGRETPEAAAAAHKHR